MNLLFEITEYCWYEKGATARSFVQYKANSEQVAGNYRQVNLMLCQMFWFFFDINSFPLKRCFAQMKKDNLEVCFTKSLFNC